MATINKSEVVIFSNHHRRNEFFEDTMLRFMKAGYFVMVQDTGGENPFGKFSVRFPGFLLHKQIASTSYDGGMMEWKRSNLFDKKVKYLVHVDNDCFVSDMSGFEEYLTEFIQDDYDFAGHLVSEASCNRYDYSNSRLAPIKDMTITVPSNPNDIPTPQPHYETSYTIIKKDLWDDLTIEEVGHMRRFVVAMHNRGAKFASHKASYRWNYTSWGKEWLHLGDIMGKYYVLASNDPFKYNPDGEFDKYRIGWFAFHDEVYPDSEVFAHPHIRARLNSLYEYFGGKEKVLDCWKALTKNTCMENWKAL